MERKVIRKKQTVDEYISLRKESLIQFFPIEIIDNIISENVKELFGDKKNRFIKVWNRPETDEEKEEFFRDL